VGDQTLHIVGAGPRSSGSVGLQHTNVRVEVAQPWGKADIQPLEVNEQKMSHGLLIVETLDNCLCYQL
jgi:hypothetical protein